jgi:hypothetical protein
MNHTPLPGAPDLPPLRFHNGEFKILFLGDLHEHCDFSDEKDRLKSQDTLRLLEAAAERLKPDLAVYAGDQGKDDDEEKMRELIRRITGPFRKRGVPCALVFGNHDPECAISKARQLELYREECPLFYTWDGAPGVSGNGNCCLQIKDGAGDRDVVNLWFFDSHNRCGHPDISYYDWMHEDQVRWYRETARALKAKNGGAPLPAIAFMHIPIPEERELLRPAKPWELPFAVRGFGSRKGSFFVKKNGVKGYLGEDPACAEINSGIFDAWLEEGDVMAVYFGHDHMNEFEGRYKGILLAQNKTAGFQVYTDGCNAGVRLITLHENNPHAFESKMYHFKKEFGLKSSFMTFSERHFHDRQIINMKILGGAAGLGAAITLAAAIAKRVKD